MISQLLLNEQSKEGRKKEEGRKTCYTEDKNMN